MEEDLIKIADISYFKKTFYKMSKYGVDYTDDMIEQFENFYMKLYDLDEKIGLEELYNLALKERTQP